MVLVVAACGRSSVSRYAGGASVAFASGPVSKACLGGGRSAANGRLCGCIQGVANRELSASDQRMAAKFFRDPHRAQEVKMSDAAAHDAFWDRYTAFAARAERTCRGY